MSHQLRIREVSGSNLGSEAGCHHRPFRGTFGGDVNPRSRYLPEWHWHSFHCGRFF